MELILVQIEAGLERGCHFLSVVSALTLPDICGALESDDGWATKSRYMAWWDKWMAADQPFLNSTDAYGLRSGVVHQGQMGKQGLTYHRILFSVGSHVLHNNVARGPGTERVLQLHAETFCHELIRATRAWSSATSEHPNVIKNRDRLLQYRPGGFPPYFRGMPVIG